MIESCLIWRNNQITKNGTLLLETKDRNSFDCTAKIYRSHKIDYVKFFKMDILSKVAFLATELLEIDDMQLEKEKVAVVLTTKSGCLDVDKKFENSRHDLASPALFVYTLPNIMLGEICIRHGFKGEQMCSFESEFRKEWFDFYISDLMQNRNTDACLFGHVEAIEDEIDVELHWKRKF